MSSARLISKWSGAVGDMQSYSWKNGALIWKKLRKKKLHPRTKFIPTGHVHAKLLKVVEVAKCVNVGTSLLSNYSSWCSINSTLLFVLQKPMLKGYMNTAKLTFKFVTSLEWRYPPLFFVHKYNYTITTKKKPNHFYVI